MIDIEQIKVEKIDLFWKLHILYLIDDGIFTDLEDVEYFKSDEYYVYVPYNTSVKGSNSTKAFRPHAFFLNLDITPYLYY